MIEWGLRSTKDISGQSARPSVGDTDILLLLMTNDHIDAYDVGEVMVMSW